MVFFRLNQVLFPLVTLENNAFFLSLFATLSNNMSKGQSYVFSLLELASLWQQHKVVTAGIFEAMASEVLAQFSFKEMKMLFC